MQTLWFSRAAVLLLAAVIDRLIGDPWGWPHPVQAMGQVIHWGTHLILKVVPPPEDAAENLVKSRHGSSPVNWSHRILGGLLGLGVVVGSGAVGWMLVHLVYRLHPLLGLSFESIVLASCFAGRSLRRAAEEVLEPLQCEDLQAARQTLSLYVGRDTDWLEQPEVLRAILETVSENTTDGVTAPLFYAILGSLIPPLGSVPLALAYKAASTLDSMIGYRKPPYTHLGWFSARLEDLLTWLPCRLTVFTVALLSGHPRHVWAVCHRDAQVDPSPNAGWSECAYAATFGVQLGGTNRYRGQVIIKPLLGDPTHPITPTIVRQALALTRHVFLSWLVLGIVGLVMIGIWQDF